MNLYEDLCMKKEKLAVVGLGYVGIVLAVAFAKKLDVIGFDINKNKINKYINGIDPTNEIGPSVLKDTTLNFTFDASLLDSAKFYVIAVPTPINYDNTPDLTPLIKASETVGKHLQPDSIVVYESTVYPGVTEEVCVPILEKFSGLKCGVDFKVGYSPERVNPGDKVHRLETTVKIVSGMDSETLETIANVYSLVIDAGVYKASSIKVAEAAKVIENSQRDINIAFVNELSRIFDKMGIDTLDVLEAAGTKWNFLNFRPGLVGGHCIGIDPYYLTYKSSLLGYTPQIILSGRHLNDDMGKYIAEKTVKTLINADKVVKNSTVAVLGITFKENCPDIRNSKVIDIINELKEYGINVVCTDAIADVEDVKAEYDIDIVDIDELHDVDAIIIAVAHDNYQNLSLDKLITYYKPNNVPILIDVKCLLDKYKAIENGYMYWRL